MTFIGRNGQSRLASDSNFDNRGPPLHGFFNQLKQEYVSARWLLYEGINSRSHHFSDHGVALWNTMDYPVYGLGIEKVRLAFRVGYSLLDKIACFLTCYFQLDLGEFVSFRTVWYTNGRRERKGFRGDISSAS